jgi:hypothetical protein
MLSPFWNGIPAQRVMIDHVYEQRMCLQSHSSHLSLLGNVLESPIKLLMVTDRAVFSVLQVRE